ncbi:MAG: glycerol-3-phosphate 1-O-acyltransferase PlsY [Aerococcus sp.]|nr:glycerol-3-phosphate 1-O-acyltransferase PlsY [Aerococcus sp.]
MGSIPFGVLVGKKFFNKDPRNYGSGNIGTTNAFRVFGPAGGFLVFFLDMLKGSLAIWIAHLLPFVTWNTMLFGIAAILGHTFSFFLKFKGGKAVATSFGAAFAYAPLFAIAAISVFFVVLFFSRMVSLASVTALIAASIMATFMPGSSLFFKVIVYLITILIIVRHKDNLKRIINGTESRVFTKKKRR